MDVRELEALDFAHLWHPFTPMRQWRRRKPFIVASAEGFTLTSVEGETLLDGVSSLWCNVHGHRVHELDEAVRDQLGRVAHSTLLGLSAEPAIRLAARLVELAQTIPGDGAPLTRVFFSDAGATATEAALKMAVGAQHHAGDAQRTTVVTLSGGYHGDTVGAMSMGFIRAMHRPFEPLTFRCAQAKAPDPRRVDCAEESDLWPSWDERRMRTAKARALDSLARTLEEHTGRVAAFVVEPVVQGAAGMLVQPQGYLHEAAKMAREAGGLVVADEVATGFARTGALFASALEEVRPDILCLAKGLSGGYLPIAATLATEAIAAAFEGEPHEGRTLYHGHTFTGNALACAASLASLELLERRRLVERSARHSERIRAALHDALAAHPHVGDVRNRGVMTGVELVASRHPWRPFASAVAAAPRVCDEARRRGLFVRPIGDVVVFNPAPAMDEETLDRCLGILIDAICAVDFAKPTKDALAATPAGAAD